LIKEEKKKEKKKIRIEKANTQKNERINIV